MINIKNHKCKNTSCFKIPFFNYPGLIPGYCIKHREDNMINTKSGIC